MLRISGLAVVLMLTAVIAAPALADDGSESAGKEPAADKVITAEDADFEMGKALGIMGLCLAAAATAVGGGLAISKLGRACIESIARQPEAGGSMFAPMVVAAAMIEGAMLFGILVCWLMGYELS